ncbi:MAG: metallophosphoesterase [Candidatus Dormiibacterota bacterium]
MIERRFGYAHPSTVRAADMLQAQAGYDTAPNQPLPEPRTPAVVTPASVGVKDGGDGQSFILIGDCGPIEDVNPQKAVAAAIQAAILADPSIMAVVIGGDVCYFDGDPAQYMPQVWQAWSRVPRPLLAWPGNHDGDPTDGVTGAGIASFMANWCDSQGPRLPQGDPQGEFNRDTQTLPYCYWAVQFSNFLLIGLYSNVASGGFIDAQQQAWLVQTMKSAPTNQPIFVGLHHPPYSIDAYHGGSVLMGATLDSCFEQSGRQPTAVLAGHIHDYQRFTRTPQPVTRTTESISYIVSGNGGYHNLHEIAGDYKQGMQVAPDVVVDYADAAQWGFVKFTIRGGLVTGTYTQVPLLPASPVPNADNFALEAA